MKPSTCKRYLVLCGNVCPQSNQRFNSRNATPVTSLHERCQTIIIHFVQVTAKPIQQMNQFDMVIHCCDMHRCPSSLLKWLLETKINQPHHKILVGSIHIAAKLMQQLNHFALAFDSRQSHRCPAAPKVLVCYCW
eukprot:c20193_g4_i17.p1 GENE.c20193_g4_i17~~c20193_g4_i17.p1  ORF type:complete len:135 (+),score=14.21 c20193_g4_i17:446-850(+)